MRYYSNSRLKLSRAYRGWPRRLVAEGMLGTVLVTACTVVVTYSCFLIDLPFCNKLAKEPIRKLGENLSDIRTCSGKDFGSTTAYQSRSPDSPVRCTSRRGHTLYSTTLCRLMQSKAGAWSRRRRKGFAKAEPTELPRPLQAGDDRRVFIRLP